MISTIPVKKPVILCVDDEQFVLNALNQQLQSKFGDRFEYEFAESADEAIKVIHQLASENYKFVMIISDHIMPGMQGDEFLAYVHKHFPSSIKVMLTGQASLQSAISAINNADLYRYLTKPWQEQDFLLTVEKGIQQYTLSEETRLQADIFSRFVPHQFLECLQKSIVDIKLGDHVEREMSVLFSDIRNFTKMSEAMTPEETYAFINTYLKYIEPAIEQNNGFIDKYIGDAVMALFDNTDDALHAAIAIQKNIQQFNVDHPSQLPIATNIGLHIGQLMLGIVGVEKRLQSTVISYAVNLASRLEALASIADCSVIVSDDFLSKLKHRPQCRFLGKIRVKGKEKEVAVFELLEGEGNDVITKKRLTLAEFEEGISLFSDGKFAEASVKFSAVLKMNPSDKPAKLYLERSAHFMVNGAPENWFIMQTDQF